jgi:hypothetical protein
MADYSFRIRFRVAGTRLNITAPSWESTYPGSGQVVHLISQPDGTPIVEANSLVLKSSGWPDEDSARLAGERAHRAFALTFAKLGIGADYGRRGPGMQFFDSFLESLSREHGRPVLADRHGLMVFETDPPPLFITGSGQGVVGTPPENLARVLPRAFEFTRPFSEKENLALDLYNASFFESSIEARFLTLVVAVEVLLEPQPKSEAGRHHVEELLGLTRAAKHIPQEERQSLMSTLGWMKTESIGQAGKRLARERLGEREYNGMKAPNFFSHVYDIRSKKVHGTLPPPSNDDIGAVVHPLQTFVRDLLLGSSLD